MNPRTAIADIETNGLLDTLHTMHCLTGIDHDTGTEVYFGPRVPKGFDFMGVYVSPETLALLDNPTGTAEEGIEWLAQYDTTVFHNGINFDYRALKALFPGRFKQAPRAWDSLVAAKLVWPYDTLIGPDMARIRAGQMPAHLLKSHSLKAWGYRLGLRKDDYAGDLRIADPVERKARMWEEPNPWMLAYAIQDPRPCRKLWQLIEKRVGWVEPEKADLVWPERVFEVEHRVAEIIEDQTAFGIRFDTVKARRMAAELANERARIEAELVETFGSWWAPGPVTTPAANRKVAMPQFPDVTKKRYSEKTGKELKPYVGPPLCEYATDAPYVPIERVTFNPSSRDHLGQRLQDVFGWKPKKFGKNGKPTVDETVLEEIPEVVIPPATRKLILDYFVVNKTLGTLKGGAVSWINMVDRGGDGRIHGKMDTSGAITGRGTHRSPNLSGTPAVIKAKGADGVEHVVKGLEGRYGWECRELFTADTTEDGHEEGWEETGVDASALELIDLGHYLVPFDGGKFRDRVCDPKRDPHTEHSELTGRTRAETKTATYLYIYGGSAYKLSLDTKVEPEEIPQLLAYRGLTMMLKNLERRFDADFVAKLDDTQKARIAKARQIILAFEGGIEGIKDLKKSVTEAAARGWLKGMDGRKLIVRKPHAALNTLLQSAGAQTCKLWMVLTHEKLVARGLVSGIDFKQVLWVHDELQFTHKPGLAPVIIECAYEAIREAGEQLGLRGTYRGDAKTGRNWAECH